MFNARLDSEILAGIHEIPINPDMSSEKLIDKYGVLKDGDRFCNKYGSVQLTDDDIDVKKVVTINIDLDGVDTKQSKKSTTKSKK